MFYIVASDLDGTLLTPDNQLTSFTKKILRLLTTMKVHFIFATGRHRINVIKIRNNLNIYDYMITSNGARIYDANDRLIASYNLDLEIIYDLLSIVQRDPHIVTNLFQQNEWLIGRFQYYHDFFFQSFHSDYKIYTIDTVPVDAVSKIYFSSNSYQKLFWLEKKINARWGSRVNVSFSLPTCLEVISGGVSKGYALELVANLLGYQLRDCISFGDGMNDQEMLAMTGKGCIMFNAQQRLKDALPCLEVIGSNKNEAVPYYLKYMYFH
ncbi:predicted hydrolase of the HAD superfamily [Candidatus Blochmanniella floridana]|uniref:Predicted hydrolase of the HAD superfamily n=1 Tax=Blochmanniella floridana TaxID=203907 RepID=Q7VRM8_BLOFL|nr:predicted hydrolase of the HAD superfamily [Candidatus Blochmannia floridanus]